MTSTEGGPKRWKESLGFGFLIFIIVIAVGTVLLVLGVQESKSTKRGYVCGLSPVPNEKVDQPVCVNIITTHNESYPPSPERPLCLRGGTNVNDTPVWCYEDVESTVGSSGYYLYWSSCDEECGGKAWRMYEEQDSRKSWFRVLSGPTDFPPDAGWTRWSAPGDKGNWTDTVVGIVPCETNQSSNLRASNFSIPIECYDEIAEYGEDDSMPAGYYVGLILMIFSVFAVCFMVGIVSDRTGFTSCLYHHCPPGGPGAAEKEREGGEESARDRH